MGIIYWLFVLFIGFGSVAMMIQEGLWSNTITFFSMVLAGITAFALFEPVTVYLDEQTGGSYTYVLDVVVIWFIYFIAVAVLRTLGGSLSKTKLLFNKPIDDIASPILALLTGYLMLGFTLATLHVAPLSRDFVQGIAYGVPASLYEDEDAKYEVPSRSAVEKGIDDASAFAHPDLVWLKLVEVLLSATQFGPGEDGFVARDFVINRGNRRDQFAQSNAKMLRVQRSR